MTRSEKRKERAAQQRRQRQRQKLRADSASRGDPKTVWIQDYRVATGTAAVLELKLRLVAELFPELGEVDAAKGNVTKRPVAHHDTNVDGIRNAIGTAFHRRGAPIPKENGQLLQRAIQLRNDLMHTDFHGARELLHKAGVAARSGGVLQLPVPRGGPDEILAALTTRDRATPVSAMTSSVGTTFGWLLELGQAGYFREATRTFIEAIKIVDGLASQASKLHQIRVPNAPDREER